MTTSQSPLSDIKRQSDKIAKTLKSIERGDIGVDVANTAKIAESRKRSTFKFAVFMDDKIINIELSWEKIRDTSEVALSEYISKLMIDKRDN